VKALVFRVLLLQVEADSEVSEFLSVLKFGTHNVYSRGLEAFQEFYSAQGSIKNVVNSMLFKELILLMLLFPNFCELIF
jgi:hypothetical protein